MYGMFWIIKRDFYLLQIKALQELMRMQEKHSRLRKQQHKRKPKQ